MTGSESAYPWTRREGEGSLPYSYFQRRTTGDLVMRVGSNTVIRETLTATTLSSLLDGGLAVIYLVLVQLLSPGMAGLALGLGAVQVAVFLFSRHKVRELMSQDLESQSRADHGLLSEVTERHARDDGRADSRWRRIERPRDADVVA